MLVNTQPEPEKIKIKTLLKDNVHKSTGTSSLIILLQTGVGPASFHWEV